MTRLRELLVRAGGVLVTLVAVGVGASVMFAYLCATRGMPIGGGPVV